MAIQMRRGLLNDFNPAKMLPGEWGVSVDLDTQKQVVYMCFSPGVVKRMGTYEDFVQQIRDATGEIKKEYVDALDLIKAAVNESKKAIDSSVVYVSGFEANLKDVTIPYIEQIRDDTEDQKNEAADFAKVSESYAIGGRIVGDEKNNAKYYAEQAAKEREKAEQLSKINMPHFEIDLSTGQLIATGGNGLHFYIDDNGNLNSEVVENG